MTFRERYLEGTADFEEIFDLTDEWNFSDDPRTLREYLGLTEEEEDVWISESDEALETLMEKEKTRMLFLTDLDGTLLDDHKQISENPRRELERILARGHVICLATGRAMRSALQMAQKLAKHLSPLRVGLVHGQMKKQQKEETVAAFRDGRLDVLAATTVIEVGVDVPNATVMVVHDADRFGLSQLHQLRGRVGRGEHPGEVYLIATARTEEARKRLGALEATDDGFKLAEYDLALRHEGDVLGCRQHGYPPLKLVDIERDRPLIDAAHEDARMLLERHPGLDDAVCRPLAEELHERFGKASQHGDGA